MAQDKAYECKICKGQVVVSKGATAPVCCGQTMQNIPMDQCLLTTTAEHTRFDQDDEPCDDGRAG